MLTNRPGSPFGKAGRELSFPQSGRTASLQQAAGPKLFGFLEHGDKESRTPGICRAKAALYL